MANQSITAVSLDVEDPIVLRRYLATLTERVDQLLGARGSETGRASTKEETDTLDVRLTAAESTIIQLQQEVADLSDRVKELEDA